MGANRGSGQQTRDDTRRHVMCYVLTWFIKPSNVPYWVMRYVTPQVREHPVSPDLKAFVHRFLHGVSEQPGELVIPPTGGIFISYVPGSPLVVHFNERVYAHKPRLFLGGQLRNERPRLRSDGRFELVGAEFTPTGYYKLFRRKANWLTDSIADFSEAHPQVATTLDHRLRSQPGGIESVISVMEYVLRELVASATEVPRVEAVINDITRSNGLIRMRDLYSKQPITSRQIRRDFTEVVGISPKHFAKICQINAVVKAMMDSDSERLRSLALDHGFYDQAHFIHDFRKFVAMDPGGFLRDKSEFLRTYLGNASRLHDGARA